MATDDFPRNFGVFTLRRELGRGGAGIVYEAEQQSLGRTVALKVLSVAPDWSDDQMLARFEREGRLMARLEHAGIVAVHDLGVHEGRPYLTMELVRGSSLAEALYSRRLGLRELVAILERVARALHYAHAQGVVHRDVKPSNILIDDAGNPKVTDFGLAKSGDPALTQSQQIMGTPFYMSPEQASGGTVDARTDVYSLGAVLYEILTGRSPFDRATIEEVLRAVLTTEPLPPRATHRAVPRDLETICLKALAKNAEDRYDTAEAFAEDLARYLRGVPISVRRMGLVALSWMWCLRHRVRTGLAAGLVLLGLASGTHLLRSSHRFKDLQRQVAAAEDLYEKGDFEGALAHLRSVRGSVVDRPELQLRRAICGREVGAHESAEREFEAYLTSFPTDANAWRHCGLNALGREDLDHTIKAYQRAAQLEGIADAVKASEAHDYDVMVALVERHFCRLDPSHVPLFLSSYTPDYDFLLLSRQPADPYGLGTEWKQLFDPTLLASASTETIGALLEQHGAHPVLLAWRALKRKEDAVAAHADLDQAVKMVAVSRWLRYLRFRVALSAGRVEEADRDVKAILALCPADGALKLAMARSRDDYGDFGRAAWDYEALARDESPVRFDAERPTVPALLLSAARSAMRARRREDAVRLIKEACRSSELRRAELESDVVLRPLLRLPEVQDLVAALKP